MEMNIYKHKDLYIVKKKKQLAQGGVACSQDGKSRLTCSFSSSQEYDLKLIKLQSPDKISDAFPERKAP